MSKAENNTQKKSIKASSHVGHYLRLYLRPMIKLLVEKFRSTVALLTTLIDPKV